MKTTAACVWNHSLTWSLCWLAVQKKKTRQKKLLAHWTQKTLGKLKYHDGNLVNSRFTKRTSNNLGRSHRLLHVCTFVRQIWVASLEGKLSIVCAQVLRSVWWHNLKRMYRHLRRSHRLQYLMFAQFLKANLRPLHVSYCPRFLRWLTFKLESYIPQTSSFYGWFSHLISYPSSFYGSPSHFGFTGLRRLPLSGVSGVSGSSTWQLPHPVPTSAGQFWKVQTPRLVELGEKPWDPTEILDMFGRFAGSNFWDNPIFIWEGGWTLFLWLIIDPKLNHT